MTYSSVLSSEMEDRIREEIDILSSLEEGQTLTITGDPTVVAQKRYAIYNWFFVSGLKGHFKVSSVSPTLLIISKKASTKPGGTGSAKVFKTPVSVDTWIMENIEHLLDVSEAKAREFIESELPPNLTGEALERWRKKLS